MLLDDATSLGEAINDFSAVIVTGGSSGIGKSFIKLFQKVRPALLICNLSRRSPDLFPVGDKLRHVSCDFSQKGQIMSGVEAVLSILNREVPEGRVLLINNSGYGSYGRFLEADLGEELGIIDVNIRALVEITGLLLSTLKMRGGAIINIASTAAFQPTPLMATYGAGKAFVLHWSLALGEELRGGGVRVLAVCPGPTATGFAARAGVQSGTAPGGQGQTPDTVAEISLRALGAGRSLVVCGWKNRLVAYFASLLPKTWAAALALRVISRAEPVEDKA
jgi:short-subunit dehydrogenase